MFWHRKKKNIKVEWGLNNDINSTLAYYAEGCVKHSPTYQYRLLCKRYVRSQDLYEYAKNNISAPSQIQALEEDQSRRDAALDLFGEPFNFWISLSASPKVGETQFLIRRGLCINVAGFDAETVARYICEFTQDILEHIDLSYLECARKQNDYTTLFWHSVVLRGYWEVIQA